jgi:hypothetical protein
MREHKAFIVGVVCNLSALLAFWLKDAESGRFYFGLFIISYLAQVVVDAIREGKR